MDEHYDFCFKMKTETIQANQTGCELILALDMEAKADALALLEQVGNGLNWVKVGLQMFTRWGPEFLTQVASRNYRIFLDLKLHDIPNTVASAVRSLAHCPVEMLTLHASGGPEMIEAAKKARDESGSEVKLIAVTILTSINEGILTEIGLQGPISKRVNALGKMAVESGVDGLVCSPLELNILRENLGNEPLLITPGIRPTRGEIDDQKRVMTPTDAAQAGSSFIVVGRPILNAIDPHAAALQIRDELAHPPK
jgi:orotidine-5'-phosphate decarboxylase